VVGDRTISALYNPANPTSTARMGCTSPSPPFYPTTLAAGSGHAGESNADGVLKQPINPVDCKLRASSAQRGERTDGCVFCYYRYCAIRGWG
jgi:hypothetical protein